MSLFHHAECGELRYLHIDDQLLIVEKPAQLLSVPGRGPDKQDCLISRVQQQFDDALIVHRLDYATSGLMVIARGKAAHRHLSIQFQDRVPRKRYQAVVDGVLTEASGLIDQPLRCDWENRPLQMVDPVDGKPAQTQWERIEQRPDSTRILLHPLTGRSHQLRVHLQSIGHVILGDEFYAHERARQAAPRLLLHADQLAIRHPQGGHWLEFESPCPF